MNPVEQISTDHYPSFDMDTGGEEESMEHCLEYYMPGCTYCKKVPVKPCNHDAL